MNEIFGEQIWWNHLQPTSKEALNYLQTNQAQYNNSFTIRNVTTALHKTSIKRILKNLIEENAITIDEQNMIHLTVYGMFLIGTEKEIQHIPTLDETLANKTKKEPIVGIYAVVNNHTQEIYVGLSINIEKRIYQHLHNKRNNKFDKKFQADPTNWTVYVLEECKKEQLTDLEFKWQHWFSYHLDLDQIQTKVYTGFNILKLWAPVFCLTSCGFGSKY